MFGRNRDSAYRVGQKDLPLDFLKYFGPEQRYQIDFWHIYAVTCTHLSDGIMTQYGHLCPSPLLRNVPLRRGTSAALCPRQDSTVPSRGPASGRRFCCVPLHTPSSPRWSRLRSPSGSGLDLMMAECLCPRTQACGSPTTVERCWPFAAAHRPGRRRIRLRTTE